jgi:hypothetical protein
MNNQFRVAHGIQSNRANAYEKELARVRNLGAGVEEEGEIPVEDDDGQGWKISYLSIVQEQEDGESSKGGDRGADTDEEHNLI